MPTLSQFISAHSWFRTLAEQGHQHSASESADILASAIANIKSGKSPSRHACTIVSEFFAD